MLAVARAVVASLLQPVPGGERVARLQGWARPGTLDRWAGRACRWARG